MIIIIFTSWFIVKQNCKTLVKYNYNRTHLPEVYELEMPTIQCPKTLHGVDKILCLILGLYQSRNSRKFMCFLPTGQKNYKIKINDKAVLKLILEQNDIYSFISLFSTFI